MAANFKYHSLQPDSGWSGLLLDIGFDHSWVTGRVIRGTASMVGNYGPTSTEEAPVEIQPHVNGRGPGKILKRGVRGGHVPTTPPFVTCAEGTCRNCNLFFILSPFKIIKGELGRTF